jgi:hypothetical protein
MKKPPDPILERIERLENNLELTMKALSWLLEDVEAKEFIARHMERKQK